MSGALTMYEHRYGNDGSSDAFGALADQVAGEMFGLEALAIGGEEPGATWYDVPEGADEMLVNPGEEPAGYRWDAPTRKPWHRQGWVAPVAAGVGGALAGVGLAALLRKKKRPDEVAERVAGEMFGFDGDDDLDDLDDLDDEEFGRILGIGKLSEKQATRVARHIAGLSMALAGKLGPDPLPRLDEDTKKLWIFNVKASPEKRREKFKKALAREKEKWEKHGPEGVTPSEYLGKIEKGTFQRKRSRG